MAGVFLRVSNGFLKAQHAFLAHLDRTASGPVQVNDEVDDKGYEYHESECRERYPMSGVLGYVFLIEVMLKLGMKLLAGQVSAIKSNSKPHQMDAVRSLGEYGAVERETRRSASVQVRSFYQKNPAAPPISDNPKG